MDYTLVATYALDITKVLGFLCLCGWSARLGWKGGDKLWDWLAAAPKVEKIGQHRRWVDEVYSADLARQKRHLQAVTDEIAERELKRWEDENPITWSSRYH